MENGYEVAEVIKYAIVGASVSATVIMGVFARYAFLKRKSEVENETYIARVQADVQRMQAETARMQDPAVRAHLAREQRLDFLREVLKIREDYSRESLEGLSDPKGVREHIDAVFGPCPNLEEELQRLEEIAQNEPPFLGR